MGGGERRILLDGGIPKQGLQRLAGQGDAPGEKLRGANLGGAGQKNSGESLERRNEPAGDARRQTKTSARVKSVRYKAGFAARLSGTDLGATLNGDTAEHCGSKYYGDYFQTYTAGVNPSFLPA